MCDTGLLAAVEGLREALRQRGSDLVLRFGAVEDALPALAATLAAGRVLTEDEVEHRWDVIVVGFEFYHRLYTDLKSPYIAPWADCMGTTG